MGYVFLERVCHTCNRNGMRTTFDLQGFITAIKARRGKQGLREVAKATGVSASTLSRIENGKEVDLTTLLAVCDWLERSPSEFLVHDVGSRAAHLARLRNRVTHQAELVLSAVRSEDYRAAREHVRACDQTLQELEAFEGTSTSGG